MSAASTNNPYLIETARDLLEVAVRLRDEFSGDKADAASLLEGLRAAQVEITDAVRADADACVKAMRVPETAHKPFIVAKAAPMIEPADGRLDLAPAIKEQMAAWSKENPDGAASAIAVVKPGDAIGCFTPASAGAPGRNVRGQAIPTTKTARPFTLGEGVALAEDGRTVVAGVQGRLNVSDTSVSLTRIHVVASNVDLSSGNVQSADDVLVPHVIQGGFLVRSDGSIHVGLDIEGSSVVAKRDVVVQRGIIHHANGGEVEAGGSIVARFCEHARLDAQGDVRIASECVDSTVRTRSRLRIEHGVIQGGEVDARLGVAARIVGNEAGAATPIGIGVPLALLKKTREVELSAVKHRKAVEKIRAAVGPLLANSKRLNPQQKERATELMFQADSLEAQVALAEQEIRKEWDEHKAVAASCDGGLGPSLVAHEKICAGARIRIDELETLVKHEIRGPVRIYKRAFGASHVLTMRHLKSDAMQDLKCAEVEFPDPVPAPAAIPLPEEPGKAAA